MPNKPKHNFHTDAENRIPMQCKALALCLSTTVGRKKAGREREGGNRGTVNYKEEKRNISGGGGIEEGGRIDRLLAGNAYKLWFFLRKKIFFFHFKQSPKTARRWKSTRNRRRRKGAKRANQRRSELDFFFQDFVWIVFFLLRFIFDLFFWTIKGKLENNKK